MNSICLNHDTNMSLRIAMKVAKYAGDTQTATTQWPRQQQQTFYKKIIFYSIFCLTYQFKC